MNRRQRRLLLERLQPFSASSFVRVAARADPEDVALARTVRLDDVPLEALAGQPAHQLSASCWLAATRPGREAAGLAGVVRVAALSKAAVRLSFFLASSFFGSSFLAALFLPGRLLGLVLLRLVLLGLGLGGSLGRLDPGWPWTAWCQLLL
jgi:hypothetical protein